jgi:hypothetical protein
MGGGDDGPQQVIPAIDTNCEIELINFAGSTDVIVDMVGQFS